MEIQTNALLQLTPFIDQKMKPLSTGISIRNNSLKGDPIILSTKTYIQNVLFECIGGLINYEYRVVTSFTFDFKLITINTFYFVIKCFRTRYIFVYIFGYLNFHVGYRPRQKQLLHADKDNGKLFRAYGKFMQVTYIIFIW